jgi:hypothetical protein
MNLKKVTALFLTVLKNSFLLWAFLGLAACVEQEVTLPVGYLEQEQMVEMLVDIHLVEGARSGTLVLGDTNRLPDYYARIYEKHGTTEEAFKTSFDWYTQHPEKMKAVYEEVIVELSKLEEEVKAKSNRRGDQEEDE